MRSTQLITGALAVVATFALVGLGAAPTGASTTEVDSTKSSTVQSSTADQAPVAAKKPGVTKERGILLECTGALGDRGVIVNIYENRTHGNFLEVQVGEGGGADEVGVSVESKSRFLKGKKVRATTKLDGKKAVIAGTAKRTKKVKHIHEVVEDAGERIVSDGTHRMLKPRLTFKLGKQSTPLSCDTAFAYKLTVTRTPIEN